MKMGGQLLLENRRRMDPRVWIKKKRTKESMTEMKVQEGPAIRGESYIKKRNAPAGREIDSVLCLARVELDMPAL